MARILVVDDEEGVRTFVAEALERQGHEVVQARDGADALIALKDAELDLMITDLRMPRVDGMTLVRAARTERPDVEVVVVTAHGAVGSAVEAMKLGAFDYLEKPVSSLQALRDLVARALERRAALVGPAPKARDVEGVPTLTWGAPSMQPIVQALRKVAASAATVLITGESGSGKEVAARTIHATSARAGKPFVAVNCAVLSESLLESELFGHEKGSFTGAHAQRRGRIEIADGGTFFLDEVGELRPSLQAKLLRVIEERAFERVGGNKTVHVDVRWVAATHRDLRALAREGLFREDLYHRLAVFPLRMPPLRERRDDIVPLAEMLLTRLSPRPLRLDDACKQRLRDAPWPGNVRELRNALERATILAQGPTLSIEHLWLDEAPAPAMMPDVQPDGSLEDLERRAIAQALAAVGGNRRDAATRLGIGLRTLYEKLKRYGIG